MAARIPLGRPTARSLARQLRPFRPTVIPDDLHVVVFVARRDVERNMLPEKKVQVICWAGRPVRGRRAACPPGVLLARRAPQDRPGTEPCNEPN